MVGPWCYEELLKGSQKKKKKDKLIVELDPPDWSLSPARLKLQDNA
jgi:hypothetical protein